jgi:hypothetical protein
MDCECAAEAYKNSNRTCEMYFFIAVKFRNYLLPLELLELLEPLDPEL